jgi:hypothetical protein
MWPRSWGLLSSMKGIIALCDEAMSFAIPLFGVFWASFIKKKSYEKSLATLLSRDTQ